MYNVIILLAFLHQDVMAVHHQVGGHHQIFLDFVLVDGDAIILEHTAGLTFGGKDVGVFRQEIHHTATVLYDRLGNLHLRNALKDREEEFLRQGGEALGSAFTEKYLRGIHRCVVVLLGVDADGQVFGQRLLEDTQVRGGIMFLLHRLNLVKWVKMRI